MKRIVTQLLFVLACCPTVQAADLIHYRPFVEEGKVWKVGWFPEGGNTAMRLEYYYFDGDTVIDNRPCKRMMCLHRSSEAYLQEGEATEWTEYVGAFFEEDRQVFHAPKDDATLHLLYDFGAAVGDSIRIYNEGGVLPCIVVLREQENNESYKGMYLQLAAYQEVWNDKQQEAVWAYDFVHPFAWREGVGTCSVPLWNFINPSWEGNDYSLISCTVGDEVLYQDTNPGLIDWLDYYDSTGDKKRKRRLDFTHTVKTRPKSPRHVQASGNDTEAALTGEYSLTELSVTFLSLQGCYSVTISDADDEAVYGKTVQTSNTIALNTLLLRYAKGEYTLTVENDSECYTASFSLPLGGDGIQAAGGQPSQRATGAVYDLSGRQVAKPSARKGIYIQNGHKLIQ